MTVEWIGIIGITLVLLLIFLRVPLTFSMLIVALVGIYFVRGWVPLQTVIETIIWEQSNNYLLSTIPMFILMGEFIFLSGISTEIFTTARKWFGRIRGGLAMSTVGASAMFAASSGSSVATTGTMGVVALKEMVNHKYDKSLASGSIISGGTLGILIPPSTMFIVYGMLTEQSIGQLLIAGIVPGILLTILFSITVWLVIVLRPSMAPTGEQYSIKEKIASTKSLFWVIVVFLIVIGGMYLGIFGPTEAGGIGATTTFLIALYRRKINLETLSKALSNTLKTTGFIFAIILGAFLLNYFLAITKVPIILAEVLTNLGLNAMGILFLIISMYILLGAIMDELAMIVITMPIVIPIIESLGFDLIWFGVIIVLVCQLALITPPIGMNIYVLKGVAKDVNLVEIYKGALIFIIPIILLLLILSFFPEIVLYLPEKMMLNQ
ncbi:TRAP transporter large permease [Virgibacillus ainsalahensis]